MQKLLTISALLAALVMGAGVPTDALAKSCRDAKGRFMKCAAAAPASNHCRDVKTKKFAKCSLPGTEPVP